MVEIINPQDKKKKEQPVFSRPKGTGEERKVRIDQLPLAEQERIQKEHSVEGLMRQGIEQQELRSRIQERLDAERLQSTVTPESKALTDRQVAEQQALLRLAQPQEVRPFAERQALAGGTVLEQLRRFSPVSQVLEKAGLRAGSAEEMAGGKVGQAITRPVGFLATTSIGGVSIAKIFSGFGRDVKRLTDEAGEIARSSKDVSDSVALGADPAVALQTINSQEAAIRARYAAASESARKSPQDIVDSLDLRIKMASDLQMVVSRRQAIERYILTGDAASYAQSLGSLSIPQNLNTPEA